MKNFRIRLIRIAETAVNHHQVIHPTKKGEEEKEAIL